MSVGPMRHEEIRPVGGVVQSSSLTTARLSASAVSRREAADEGIESLGSGVQEDPVRIEPGSVGRFAVRKRSRRLALLTPQRVVP